MNDQQKREQDSGVRDQEMRAALDQHWAASDANDFETEHRIYRDDAVLDYRSRASEPAVDSTAVGRKRFICRLPDNGQLV